MAALLLDEDAAEDDEVVVDAAGFAASPEDEPPEVEPADGDAPEVDFAAPVVDVLLDRESLR
ncbi:hypothetical protein [Cellulomonas hominis]|uniref:hypothetical protein n=1 Tax=Cellulomonas hominis TaxID=156981 RepID=UPI0032DEFB66